MRGGEVAKELHIFVCIAAGKQGSGVAQLSRLCHVPAGKDCVPRVKASS